MSLETHMEAEKRILTAFKFYRTRQVLGQEVSRFLDSVPFGCSQTEEHEGETSLMLATNGEVRAFNVNAYSAPTVPMYRVPRRPASFIYPETWRQINAGESVTSSARRGVSTHTLLDIQRAERRRAS